MALTATTTYISAVGCTAQAQALQANDWCLIMTG
jgi:hypothetical protein